MHSTSEAAWRYLKEMKRALLAFPSSKSQASIPGHHGQKGRLRQRNAEQLLKATRPLLKVVSEHCCSLAKHILTLSFGDWDCFARSLALNVCDLKPSVGWKGSETTLWSSVKRYALKSTQKGVGILHWIISYRRESCALNPLDFTMSHSLRATLWSGEGECWPHSSGSVQDDQLLLESLLEMSHSSPFALQPMSKTKWCGKREWRYWPQSIRFYCGWKLPVSCWTVQSVSMTNPIILEKRKKNWMETNLMWFYNFQLQQSPIFLFLTSC